MFIGSGIGHQSRMLYVLGYIVKVTGHVQKGFVTDGHEYDHETTQNIEGNEPIIEGTNTEPMDYEDQGDENEDIEEVDANEELNFGYGDGPD